jgi:hypothetical protein
MNKEDEFAQMRKHKKKKAKNTRYYLIILYYCNTGKLTSFSSYLIG